MSQPEVIQETSEQKIIESNVLILDNVFNAQQVDSLLCLVEHWQNRFLETETGDDNTRSRDTSRRDSLVLFEFEPIFSFFRVNLYRYAPLLQERFGYQMQMHKGFECQLTAHNDGHFYMAHTDYTPNTGTRVSLRELTFVYYFYRQPKAFSGGELYIWDNLDDTCSPPVVAQQGKLLEPLNNIIVFFNSNYLHQ
ncbi:MAG: 2OG-Fe(II) oxygenase, partial [Candidatus Caenarcaniphilales bacterium]|nr:2OG-Fe(II) oxygenase [Candidatus Caenarcaniphilales bacterium]